MAFEKNRRRRKRSAVRRAWLFCLLLALPALLFEGILLSERQVTAVPATLLIFCLLIYLALISASLIEGMTRPLQTLSNVVSSLREGDYSFRARGAVRDTGGLSGVPQGLHYPSPALFGQPRKRLRRASAPGGVEP